MPKLITVGELIDKSWEHYRDNFIDLMSISGWLLVISILDIVGLLFYPTATKLLTGANFDASEQFGSLVLSLSAWIVAPLLSLWVFTSLVRLIRQQNMKMKPSVKLAMKEGARYFLPAILISLFILLILLGGFLLGLGPGFLLAFIASTSGASSVIFIANLLVILGLFVAFAINLRWSVHYIFGPYALLLEDKHGMNALRYSKRLIVGRFWNALLLLAVPKIVFILFAVVAMALLGFLTHLAVGMAAGLNVDVQLRLITITTSVFPVVIAALINPLIAITDVLLFNSLKEVSGGKA